MAHTAKKNLEANCWPQSVRTRAGGPYANTQSFQKALATDVDVMVRNGEVRVSLLNRSVITNK